MSNPGEFSERISGLTVLIILFRVLIPDIYLLCGGRNDESFIAYRTASADLDNFILIRNADGFPIVEDMICDPAEGKLFEEIDVLMRKYTLGMTDSNGPPPNSFKYISSNDICSSSWRNSL